MKRAEPLTNPVTEFPHALDVNVMGILALILNKVRHFYYSFLDSLCFSWNGRALRGAHLPCSGVSPLGCLVSRPNAGSLSPAAQSGTCGFVTGIETLKPTKTKGKTLIQIYCLNRSFKSPFLPSIIFSSKQRRDLLRARADVLFFDHIR